MVEFGHLIDQHDRFTIVSHIYPDADAIGTSLGIYIWLKEQGKKVEVVNATEDIPRNLDFLPYFSKIKNKMDFKDSLIISCDSGSVDRLGFDVGGRTIVNIDHHPTNTNFGTLNVVEPEAAASSQVAYGLLSRHGRVSSQSATAFYAALISDTRNFTTTNTDKDVFAFAEELVGVGVNVSDVTSQMLHRRSLASLRILGVAIESLELTNDAKIAIMTITRADRQRCGAKGSDLDGIVDYAKSLVTAQIAIMIVERKADIKVSIRSKGADVSQIAEQFGGGGHKVAAGFEIENSNIDDVTQRVLDAIKQKELLR